MRKERWEEEIISLETRSKNPHEQTLTNKYPALYAIRAEKVQKKNNKQKKPQLPARGQNQGKEKNKLAYAPKSKIPPPSKRESPTKESTCIFTIELDTFPNKYWVYDTGCGTHMCNTTQDLRESRKLKPGALSLYVGNGQRTAVEAIGTYHLCLPSGLVIVLNNYHYAPSITRGINSVSCLYDDGYVNRFVDNTISVFRNNLVYFSVVTRDGIFEIDLSNSNTNDSSMYVVSNKRAKLNLDFALLWHCHPGHISKKHIEKLQHEHKHEVFETFKVFQKEVENQLEKTIKSLRSDRGGEYMSQEFLDHLKKHRIIAHRTPPYTPQHNGVSKRINRTLLDMVRSMMSQTTLPKSFWDYALETVSRILNMVQTKKVEKTPYEVWHGKAPKLSYLKVWGYPKEIICYSFYYPPENKVLVAQNAEFLENSLITQEASGSLEDLESIQEEDTHPSIDTSLNHEEDDLKIDEPLNDIIPIRRSTRTRNALDRMYLYLDAEEHELRNLGEPTNYKAMGRANNDVWDLVDLSPNGKTVGRKWLFKKKTDMDGAVHTFKALLVAKSFTQTYGVDYEETFSPRFHMENSECGSIPMQEKLRLSKSQGASIPAELKHMQNVPYASAVGSIMYAVRYANDLKSQTEYVFVLNGGDVDWKSTKQSIFVTSSVKAEFIATYDGSKKAVWVRNSFMGWMLFPQLKNP
uniref:Integrase catalytic domain-containing protein n=1 Tax=Tanacetum cinerariifolium TaxID=118510 RepID=A0A699GZF3_TANCI|nr:hypothetical protein [Tanacetum cinerariifolium]